MMRGQVQAELEPDPTHSPDAAEGGIGRPSTGCGYTPYTAVDDQQSVDYDLRGLFTVLLDLRSRPDCALGD